MLTDDDVPGVIAANAGDVVANIWSHSFLLCGIIAAAVACASPPYDHLLVVVHITYATVVHMYDPNNGNNDTIQGLHDNDGPTACRHGTTPSNVPCSVISKSTHVDH